MRPNGLADVFVEWAGRAPDDRRSVLEIQEAGCFQLYGLHWQESFIAQQERRRICHYRAPDAESVRIAFRQAGIEVDAVWSGTVIEAQTGGNDGGIAIDWPFEPPWPADAGGALERARAGLGSLGIEPAHAIVPAGCRRILCFCADSGPVRSARLPVFAWAFRHVAR